MTCGKNDKNDHLIAMAMLDAPNPYAAEWEDIDDSDVILSESLNKKVAVMIRKQEKREMSFRQRFLRSAVGAAAILVIVCSMVLAIAPKITAVRDLFWNVETEKFDTYLLMCYKSELSNFLAPPARLEAIQKPTFLPENSTEHIIRNEAQCYRALFSSVFQGDSSEKHLTYDQRVLTEPLRVATENAVHLPLEIGKYGGLYVEYDDGSRRLVWTNGIYWYSITSSDYNRQELIAIAESVR